MARPVVTVRDQAFYGEATYNPASLADAAGTTTTITVVGAEIGDLVAVSYDKNSAAGVIIQADVIAADTVRVRLQNETAATADLTTATVGTGTLRAMVWRLSV